MSEPSIRISETDFLELQEAVLDLSESSARLAGVLQRLSTSCRWDVVAYPIPEKWLKETRKLQESLQFFGLETGPPPETPSFLLNLSDKLADLETDGEKEAIVRPIFLAGFWAKVALECRVPFETEYFPKKALHWLVLRGGSWAEPALFVSEEDSRQFIPSSIFENTILQPLGDWSEVFIFCSGAGIDPPSQWRWRKQI